jgi:hypothetical protein
MQIIVQTGLDSSLGSRMLAYFRVCKRRYRPVMEAESLMKGLLLVTPINDTAVEGTR